MDTPFFPLPTSISTSPDLYSGVDPISHTTLPQKQTQTGLFKSKGPDIQVQFNQKLKFTQILDYTLALSIEKKKIIKVE